MAQLLADYVLLVGCEASRATWAKLLGPAVPPPAAGLRSSATGLALREGAFGLYEACGSAELQFLFSLLCRAPSSGEAKEGLHQLKAAFERLHQYTGKV